MIGCEQLGSCLRLIGKLGFLNGNLSLEHRYLHLLLSDGVGQPLSLVVDDQLLRVELLAQRNWRESSAFHLSDESLDRPTRVADAP